MSCLGRPASYSEPAAATRSALQVRPRSFGHYPVGTSRALGGAPEKVRPRPESEQRDSQPGAGRGQSRAHRGPGQDRASAPTKAKQQEGEARIEGEQKLVNCGQSEMTWLLIGSSLLFNKSGVVILNALT